MSSRASRPPLAAIFSCAGPRLRPDERALFAEADPLGLILFARNCENPEQLRGLTAEFRAAVGRTDAPVLIDQEGGRVQRLRPPHWRAAPAAGEIGALAERDPAAARRAAWLNGRLLAAELSDLGIDVNCAPSLDLHHPGASDAIGDRAFGANPNRVAELGRAMVEGLAAGGVLPVIKHLPGHGRATVDSHTALPRIAAALAELEASDFAPFRALRDCPLGMTGHLVLQSVDAERPATVSAAVIADLIRGVIGFDGLLFSDDLDMAALAGDVPDRARRALAAGCDVALYCWADVETMAALAETVGPMRPASLARWHRALAWRSAPRDFDRAAGLDALQHILHKMLRAKGD